MDADTSEKIRDVISFVHSRTLSIGIYSPGRISVTNMYEEAASDLAEIIKEEIVKARIDELETLRGEVKHESVHTTQELINSRQDELRKEIDRYE